MDIVDSDDEQNKSFRVVLAREQRIVEPERRRADRAELERFIFAVFRNCVGYEGWLALSSFEHEARPDRNGRPRLHSRRSWIPFGGSMIDDAAEIASETANQSGDRRAVFSPPVALFGAKLDKAENRTAAMTNVVAAPVIAVEMDERPVESLSKLTGILGQPTLIVASGGIWTSPEGGSEPKRHCYWRLSRPAAGADELFRLTRARRYACLLVGADESGIPINHPMRWPGSWHTKGEPRLCRIVGGDADRDVDLDEALVLLETAIASAGLQLDETAARSVGERRGFKTPRELDASTLMDAVRLIPNEGLAWDDWNRIGMAMWDASWASVDGLEAWHAWSEKDPRYDPATTDARWSHWSFSPPSNLSAGTLIHSMRNADPTYRPKTDYAAKFFEPPATASDATETHSAVREAVDASAPDFILELNRKYAFVVVGGKAGVISEKKDGTVVTLAENTFKAMFANRTVIQSKKESTWAEVWWTHPARRQFLEGVDFEPKGVGPGIYNLWRGLPVLQAIEKTERPAEGCPLILRHMLEIICDGDEEAYHYLLGWLAHMVQRPSEKPGVAVVLRGKKGNGKDTIGEYMREILLPYYMHVSSEEGLTGDKNGHVANKLLLHVEEAVWAGSRKGESILKSLITAPFMGVRFMFTDRVLMKSKLRVLMSSNADWVVPASEDERRYFVLNVSDKQRHKAAWFDPLRAELEGDGPAYFAQYLQAYDISEFDVRRPPRTAALDRQKQESVSPLERWVRDELLGSEGTTWSDPDQPFTFAMKTLQERFGRDAPRQLGASPTEIGYFSKRLKQIFKLGEPKQHRSNGRERVYVLPARDEARELFDAYSGSKNDWS